MYIAVKVLSEIDPEVETLGLEVTPQDKIKKVKTQINSMQQSLPPCKQLLIYAGQQLEDGHSLEEYGVENESTIFLVLKPNGMVITIRKNDSQQSLLANIDVESTSTVADVKRCISRVQPGKLSPEIILHFDGRLLQDELTLRDNGVGPLSTILLSEKLGIRIQIRWTSGETRTVYYKVHSTMTCAQITYVVMRNEHLLTGDGSFYLYSPARLLMEGKDPIYEYNIESGSLLHLMQERTFGGGYSLPLPCIFCCYPCLIVVEACDNCLEQRRVGYQPIPGSSDDVPQTSAPAASQITVRLPNRRSITVEVLAMDKIRQLKSRIEAVEPCYPAPHQRLIQPGCLNDLNDDIQLLSVVDDKRLLVLRGKLVSVIVKKHNGLPGILTLDLEYFDTVKRMKEEIHLDKNMKVPPQQQQLLFEQELLDDNQTLSQCGIGNGSQITLNVLAPTCQQLMSELLKDSVACRYERFAVHLGLRPDTIEVITMNHSRDAYRCLINIINHWVNNYQVSWSAVTTALDNIDCRNMAEMIGLKYNVV